jgi:hypothetical protein
MSAEATKQNTAQKQQSESLPEPDGMQAEQRRQQPVPQLHHYPPDERHEQNDCRRGNKKHPFPSHVGSLTSS